MNVWKCVINYVPEILNELQWKSDNSMSLGEVKKNIELSDVSS